MDAAVQPPCVGNICSLVWWRFWSWNLVGFLEFVGVLVFVDCDVGFKYGGWNLCWVGLVFDVVFFSLVSCIQSWVVT